MSEADTPSGAGRATSNDLADRYALARFGEEGVLLDLESGDWSNLNPSAAFICDRLTAGRSAGEVAEALSAKFDLPHAKALDDARAGLGWLLAMPRSQDLPRGPMQGEPIPGGYAVSVLGRPVWRIDAEGRELRLTGPPPRDAHEAFQWIKWMIPHALILQGRAVLHASAAATAGGALAIAGESGAGKSTTARAFVEAGFGPVCDDLLVLRFKNEKAIVAIEAEQALFDWAQREAVGLAANPKAALICSALGELAGEGTALPLARVVFLSATRGAGEAIGWDDLDPRSAMGLLLSNSFAELGGRAVWRRVFEFSARVAANVGAGVLTAPEGLPALRAAARSYNWISRS